MGQHLSDMSEEDPNEVQGGSPNRNDGNGRYNLRSLPSRSPDGQGSPRASPEQEQEPGQGQGQGQALQPPSIQGRNGDMLQNHALRSVLQFLADYRQDDNEQEDDEWLDDEEISMTWDQGNVRVDEMLFMTSDDDDSSYDDDDTAASVGVSHVLNSMRRRRNPRPAPSAEMVRTLDASDFSGLTRKRLGLEPLMGETRPEEDQASTSNMSEPKAKKAGVKVPAQQKTPLLQLLVDREIGGFKRISNPYFSSGCRCRVMNHYLPNHREKVATFSAKLFCGSYSNCGDLFMSACQDQKIRLYDTSHGQFRRFRTIQAQNVGWSVLDTVLSPDKRHLVYSSWCEDLHQVSLYDANGDLIRGDEVNASHVALPLNSFGSRFCVFSLRYSNDGDEILCGANDGFIYLYDRGSNSRDLRIAAHEDDVNAVSFVDSATHILASGGDDGFCKIWDRRSLRESHPVPVGTLAGHTDGITYIDPRGDGRHLITNSKDQTIKLWDLRKFSSQNVIDKSREALNQRTWDYRWQTVPKQVLSKSLQDDTSIMTFRGHDVLRTLIRAKFSPAHTTGQKYIYAGSACGALYIYDTLSGNIETVLRGHSECVRDLSWHPYLPEIVTSSWDTVLCRWMYKDRQEKEKKKSKNKTETQTEPMGPRRSKRARTLRSRPHL